MTPGQMAKTRKTASRLCEALDAGRTEFLGNSSAVLKHGDFLNVDLPVAARRLAGPRAVVAKLSPFSTSLTLGHYCYPPHIEKPWSTLLSWPQGVISAQRSKCSMEHSLLSKKVNADKVSV